MLRKPGLLWQRASLERLARKGMNVRAGWCIASLLYATYENFRSVDCLLVVLFVDAFKQDKTGLIRARVRHFFNGACRLQSSHAW